MNTQRLSMSLTLMGLPLVLSAAPPVGYDQWSVSGGAVDTGVSCSATGVTCTTLSADDGFIQEQVDTGNYSYIRVIVTDRGASGNADQLNFASESFVPFAFVDGGITQGLAAQQTLRDPAEGLTDVTQIQTGHMKFNDPAILYFNQPGVGDGTPPADRFNISIDQRFDTADMTSSFNYVNYTAFASGPASSPDTSTVIGAKTDIKQNVLIGNPGDISKQQAFDQRQRSGYMGNGTASGGDPDGAFGNYFAVEPLVTASADPITLTNPQSLSTVDVTWTEGETIKTTWIGQSSNVDDNVVGFNYQRAENVDAGVVADQYALDLPTPANPFDWDTPNFGTMPSLP